MFERTQIKCRHLIGSYGSAARARRRPFHTPAARRQYAPHIRTELNHIFLDLEVDPEQKGLSGVMRADLKVRAQEVDQLKFDQGNLEIQSVSVDGKSLKFEIGEEQLWVSLPQAKKRGEKIQVEVTYRVVNSGRGIYFTGPDSDYPKKDYQVWTQGQDEDAHYWFPTFYYPNQKTTIETKVSVPPSYQAIANGGLVSSREEKGRKIFHYRLSSPIPTYLVSLVVGKFDHWEARTKSDLLVEYYVEKGRRSEGERSFDLTPKMIEAFEQLTGVPYPYEKYSQVAVQDFIFGGMENASCTTQTDWTLHDARAHLDKSSDPLVSHELAHQWFGDLVTCRDWSHAWLNEGFATFMERVWIECKKDSDEPTGPKRGGQEGGRSEADYYSYLDWEIYLSEDSQRYRRPIVCNDFDEPIDIFDRHLYNKGGLVLNLLRWVLGEDEFWRSIHTYLERHRNGSVETLDLIRAIEDTTGKNTRRFFDEWVYGAGHPEFELQYNWNEQQKLIELVIEQKQTGGKPSVEKDGVTTYLFHLPAAIEVVTREGEKRVKIELREARQCVYLQSESKPLMVRFDPDSVIPKTMKFPRPKEMLLAQLSDCKVAMGRIEAAWELKKYSDHETLKTLKHALLEDSFWGVQCEVAKVLSQIGTAEARNILIEGLGVAHAKARLAIVQELGKFAGKEVENALFKSAQNDASYEVEARATLSWVRVRTWGEKRFQNHSETEEFLLNQFKKESYLDSIRRAVLSGSLQLPGMAEGERPRLLELIFSSAQRGHSLYLRTGAIRCLGELCRRGNASLSDQCFSLLRQIAMERDIIVRESIVSALENSGKEQGIPILQMLNQTDQDGRVRRDSFVATENILLGSPLENSFVTLKKNFDLLSEQYKELKTDLEKFKVSRGSRSKEEGSC